jgi:hypothetical protein
MIEHYDALGRAMSLRQITDRPLSDALVLPRRPRGHQPHPLSLADCPSSVSADT